MTRSEAAVLVDKIRRLYITQFHRYTPADINSMVEVWADTFKDHSLEEVMRAVNVYADRGKPFVPNPPDIINELIHLDEYGDHKLFNQLRRAAELASEGGEHITIVDHGGIYRDPSSPTGYSYRVPEAKVTYKFTQADFSELPLEIQMYVGDVDSLKKIHSEIESSPVMARRRFTESIPYIKAKLNARDSRE